MEYNLTEPEYNLPEPEYNLPEPEYNLPEPVPLISLLFSWWILWKCVLSYSINDFYIGKILPGGGKSFLL